MALADTGRAIGSVARLLKKRLLDDSAVSVAEITVGKPNPTGATLTNPRLNLFLYEIHFDEHLKNFSLDEGQPTPSWLVLRYLLTAFDEEGESDSIEAHEFLGEGIRALQDLNFFSLVGLPSVTHLPLSDNPDMLKLSFEEASSDLLSRLMQGSEERYRCSVSFQVRPVMIAAAAAPAYALLVGVNYQASTIREDGGVRIPLLPSMGPAITSVSPVAFEVGSSFTITGTDLNLAGLSVMLGSAELPVTAQRPDRLTCEVSAVLAGGTILSAGSHPVAVVQTLATGRKRTSNLLIGDLLPRLDTAAPNALARTDPASPDSNVVGNIDLTGVLLGTADDDVFVGLYRNGEVVQGFDQFVIAAGPTPQTEKQLQITVRTAATDGTPARPDSSVPPGTYRVILRVNGEQAVNSPAVDLVAP